MKRFVVVLLLFFSNFVSASQEDTISIVYNRGIAPIKFTDTSGQPSGILNEYWMLLAEKSGITFEFQEVDSFRESLNLVRNGEVDLHAGLFYTEERSEFLEYSEPILKLNYYIYSAEDIPVPETLQETRGFILGVVQGGYTENYIKKVIPSSNLSIYKDFSSMFEAVLAGELKVFVSSDIHLNYYLSSRNIDNPFHHSGAALYEQTYYGAAKKQNKRLIHLIKQAQKSLDSKDKENLRERWLHFTVDDAVSPNLSSLTEMEYDWLLNHSVLRVSNEMDWPPFDFNVNGQPMGFSIDLLNLIANRLGITLEYEYGHTWNELQDMIKNKKLDIIHSLNHSEFREQFILFTEPYVSNQTVIVTRKGNAEINGIDDLEGKKIAAIAGYNQKKILEKRVKGVQFISVASPLEALKSVSSGEADATIRFNGVASYLIHQHLLNNLRFVKEFDFEGDNLNELFLGTRDDWPVLQSILQKGLESITVEEMNNLKRKWISFQDVDSDEIHISFTPEEKHWLQNNERIRLGADYRWPPFDFVDEAGEHTGLAADYVKVIEKRTGLKVDVEAGVWSDVVEKMKNGMLDGLACAVETTERKGYLDFSSPYLSVPTVIVAKKENNEILDLEDLNGKTVSINKSSYMHDWLREKYPQFILHLSSSNEESLEAVSYGEADAYIGNLAVANYIKRKKLLTNLSVVKKLDDMETAISVAVDNKQPILAGIVEKVLNSLSDQEHQAILAKWYSASTGQKISLSNEEKNWLREHRVVRLAGDPAWAPLSYVDKQGDYKGILPDYFKQIEEKSGINFEVITFSKWSDVLTAMEAGEIDVIDGITENAERGKLMDFTDVYITADVVLITRNDTKYIKGLDYVGKRRIGTVKGYITESYLRADYPQMYLHLFDTAEVGLKALSNNHIDVFVIDIPTFEYYTTKSSLANLKISGLTQYSFSLAIGVRKGMEELGSILNKTLGILSQKEKNDIYNNWVTLKGPLVDYSLFWKLFLAAFLFLTAFGYWNRRLTHEIRLRKVAENNALQASKAKSDFLANMSHEIRTPMNSVLGFAELLDNMITDPEQKSYLKSIRSGGKSLLSIINDILDLSKIEAGKMGLNPESVSVNKLFDEMYDFFKNKMEQKKLEFICTLPEEFPPYIMIDGIRLRQILINLIGNGLKFTDKGRIELKCSDLQLTPENKSVTFSLIVRDTGIGIPADQQKIIFKKFEQRDGQDDFRYGGTGLGLSICESLMTMMNGEIGVESALGKGTTFTLNFTDVPLARKSVIQEKVVSLAAEGFLGGTILVVDDVKDNRELIVGHFKGSGLSFHQAENGEVALDLLNRVSVDLIFLDLRMPVLNGYEVISRLKNNEKLATVPVIAVTASVMGEDLRKVDQYGFDGYLRKPVERQDLFGLASEHLKYQHFVPVESEEADFTLSDASINQLIAFKEVAEKKLFPEWNGVKDSGDFERIAVFTGELRELAEKYQVTHFVEYCQRLERNIESFEIMEVDRLMRKFPGMIEILEDRLMIRND